MRRFPTKNSVPPSRPSLTKSSVAKSTKLKGVRMKTKQKISEIVQFVRNEDGTMEIIFAEDSKARSVTMTTDYEATIKVKRPRCSYQCSDRIVGISIRA